MDSGRIGATCHAMLAVQVPNLQLVQSAILPLQSLGVTRLDDLSRQLPKDLQLPKWFEPPARGMRQARLPRYAMPDDTDAQAAPDAQPQPAPRARHPNREHQPYRLDVGRRAATTRAAKVQKRHASKDPHVLQA